MAIAPNKAARALAHELASRARPIESSRPYSAADIPRFISDVDSVVFDSLRVAYRPVAGSEAAFLIDALESSSRIYALNRAARNKEISGYVSNAYRERYMKAQFMVQYRDAQRSGDSLPRVLVKVGSTHGGNWRSETYVQSLGNFLNQYALANGRTAFHLVVWLVNEPGTYWTLGDDPSYLPLARTGSPSMSYVVDFRPLRDLWYAGKLRALSADLRDAVFGYDAVLLLGSGSRGTYPRLRTSEPRH